MVKDEIQTVLNLRPLLSTRAGVGQDHALRGHCPARAHRQRGLEDPNKPRGVFMFVGPSGVGKTETALALADVLYGGERKFVTINMSEYQEAHSVSGLKGSPPGYVGYGEGGVLTEAVRRNPIRWCCWTKWKRRIRTCSKCSSRCSTRARMDDAEGRELTSATR